MHDKNSMLARENSALKAMISQKAQAQEEILKKAVKSEYCQGRLYKEMLDAIEGSIQALQQSIEECKRIQQALIKSRGLLGAVTDDCARGPETKRDAAGAQCSADDEARHLRSSPEQLFEKWENK